MRAGLPRWIGLFASGEVFVWSGKHAAIDPRRAGRRAVVFQRGETGGCGRADSICCGLARSLALITSKEEELFLQDRSTYLATVSIEIVPGIERLHRGVSKGPCNGSVDSVQITILEVLVGSTVEMVSAGHNVRVELTTRGVTEFGRKLVGNERELSDGVIGDVDERTSNTLVVVVNTFDGEIVVTGTLSAN